MAHDPHGNLKKEILGLPVEEAWSVISNLKKKKQRRSTRSGIDQVGGLRNVLFGG